MHHYQFQWIEDFKSLSDIQLDWLALLESTPEATPFHHPNWVLNIGKHFQFIKPCCLAVYQNSTLIALSLWQRDHISGLKGLRTLGAGEKTRLTPEYLDTLCHPKHTTVLPLIAEQLKHLQHWQIIHLPDQLSKNHNQTLSTSFHNIKTRHANRYLIPLNKAHDPLELFPKSQKKRLSRNLRRLMKSGDYQLQSSKPETFDEDWLNLQLLHKERWQNKSVYDLQGFAEFHATLLKKFQNQGRIWQLTSQGKPLAAIHLLEDKDTWYYYQSGYAKSSANYLTPLALLHLMLMREAQQNNIQFYDLMRGDDDSYKTHYPCTTQPVHDCLFFKSKAVYLLFKIKLFIKKIIK